MFIIQSYFWVPNNVRSNNTHFFTMKITNNWELQELTIIHSSDTKFDEFKRRYRKCTAEAYSFLVIDATLPLDNALRFRKNLLELVYRAITSIDDKIRDGKLQSNINWRAAKISASSGKIDKYGYHTGEDVFPPQQHRTTEEINLLILHLDRHWKKKDRNW